MNRKRNKIKETSNDLPKNSQVQYTINVFIAEKIKYIQEIIRNTIVSIKKNTYLEIFSNSDANLSINMLTDIYLKTKEIETQTKNLNDKDADPYVDTLQKIIDKLSMLISGFGTKNIDDLLFLSFGSEYKNIKTENECLQSKYELIRNYVQPTGYKVINWKQIKTQSSNQLCSNKITDEIIKMEDENMFECFDVEKNGTAFHQKINGIRVIIQNEKQKKTLVITGILDDINLECFTNAYINKRKSEITQLSHSYSIKEKKVLNRIMETMTLKDALVYGNEDIQKKMIAVFTEVNYVKQTKIDITIKKFLDLDIYSQRNMLINLLIYNEDDEIQYVCYLFYDLITANNVDSQQPNEQIYIYDSLPWKIKEQFKDIVKYTMKHTHDMIEKYDVHKISFEQQIYLMKASDNVKEKAILKLKEIKGKSDESGLKAKQYLEGLLKIPFGVYREETILKKMKEINKNFIRISTVLIHLFPQMKLVKKDKYTLFEMADFVKTLDIGLKSNVLEIIKKKLDSNSIRNITTIIQDINIIKKTNKHHRFPITNQTKASHIEKIMSFLKENINSGFSIIADIFDKLYLESSYSLSKTIAEANLIKTNIKQVETTMEKINHTLDESIYSHLHAKNQIMKIIAQWINGEQNGYCFGFEGSPGIGKTSLAKKGLSNCLTDDNGTPRPFSFIALGGSCNGSTLEGHGYTYVNSTWGKIVDILMESKCMNPIIYIDELDKVSKTEFGREIISIFTHLIDSTQNDAFQDKYFNGINIDLSKALFIFSYNDPSQIDKVLLDRIHRIKFENLTLQDKMEIVKKFILPEINTKMGFENVVEISDEMIEEIIEKYTMEPGVRKLKEVLFDLFGEINLEILKCKDLGTFEIPIKITRENLESKYLTKYNTIQEIAVHTKPKIGIINGLWANSLGRGGIIPIQTLFFPSSSFLDLQLTGLQGDVMKESMNVAKTLAWNLTSNEVKKKLLKHFEETKCQGLHIHCPEGAISKDGPSAGAAITTAIYSLFNEIQIINNIAITGEISLNGEISAIGGLEIKIVGGLRAGVKTFLYPKANSRDFQEWKKKNTNRQNFQDVEFHEVTTIQEVFDYAFV
uniref:Lon proteolytic domain-containing protein n=1 Tax=viral metagenome TaxID=1070528 RepID=A0A6C0JHJ6_9ZZZZ